MTVCIAVEKDGQTCLATDSMRGNLVPSNVVPIGKAVRVEKSLVAVSGFEVMLALLRQHQAEIKPPGLSSPDAITSFFLGFYRFLRNTTLWTIDNENDDIGPFANMRSNFLVVNASGIFFVGASLSAVKHRRFSAIGSGELPALGAAEVLYDTPMSASQIAKRSAEAAMQIDDQCGGEVFTYKVLP